MYEQNVHISGRQDEGTLRSKGSPMAILEDELRGDIKMVKEFVS
jgi:hypothetical protein